mmetsp:Transcript_17849/g.32311  ORF Transcript_17849/g.32311 Transcript_17849/m.32311 type:complete len:119 (-) Transcript_17849:93-449(-)
MDGWILGQLAFAYTFHKIRPAQVIDKLIEIFLDVIIPGKGISERTWFERTLRSAEQHSERSYKEMEIRSDLRTWDQDYPTLHHELIVRYAVSTIASAVVVSIFNRIRGPRGPQPKYYY